MRTLVLDIQKFEGKEVELMGWVDVRRDHGKLIFIDLRDRSGIAQVVFTPAGKNVYTQAQALRSEWVIRVRGEVKKRPAGMENPKIPNGAYEVKAADLEVFTEAKTPPFDLSGDGRDVGEEIRMRYRYLDLRRQRLQKNVRSRAKITQFMRGFLAEQDFVEVETPILGKSTPEGARDYLVPARLHQGKFYALPQSPQQYKQLLMVAGLERYFQIARCFRDEDTRGDRQPEFTQLDIEMSFSNEEEILGLVENMYIQLIKKLFPEKKIQQVPFPRLTFKEVMEKYNSDKPDLRKDKNNPDEIAFAFVIDFPMFEWKETEKRWDAVHHPFTMPKVKDREDFLAQFKKDPSAIAARQYDVVLNGYEIGGGSIRIYDPALLQSVFEVMGNKPEDVKEKFGHMLEAFEYGVPPHGGVALGLDRIFAILFNEPNIREVIAFPKTGDGRDLLMGAPSGVS
ncbi:aspartate--tRNA ligase, partial [Candidatus Jorgensenbacteria bacterium]|nr:aspartate--tRNA ligase [Candidatus Jorgensenbacteria bacterium]